MLMMMIVPASRLELSSFFSLPSCIARSLQISTSSSSTSYRENSCVFYFTLQWKCEEREH